MVKILFDTNFLMVPGRFKIDIAAEAMKLVTRFTRFAVMSGTISELESLKTKGKLIDRTAAGVGLEVLKRMDPLVIESGDTFVDDAIVDYCSSEDCIVATQDKELKLRLKGVVKGIIILRGKSHLQLKE